MYETSTVIWTLADALTLIQTMQFRLKPLGFHVALAGGVLNSGASRKDLDLVFLPLTNDTAPAIPPLMGLLCTVFGQPDVTQGSHSPNPYTPYREQWNFPNRGKRIDVFIV